jgi:hypothetical protein
VIQLSTIARALTTLGTSALLAACSAPGNGDGGADANTSCTSSGEQSAVISQLTFERVNMGVSQGFDLDGRVSTESDSMSCNQADYTAPDGTAGIDNQASILFDAIDAATNNALTPAVQTAINNGQLLLTISLEHVDDPMNDPCIDVVFRKVTGMALVGTNGMLTPNQTFDVEPMQPTSTVHAAIVNGVVDAGPFELSLPITVLTANFTITVHNAHLRLQVAADGSLSGLVGGGISVADVIMIASGLKIGADTIDTIATTIRGVADLQFDAMAGECQQVSATIGVQTVPAFVNP